MLHARSTIHPGRRQRAKEPPSGREWLHEIKHDAFRIMGRRNEKDVRLFTRNGYNSADRFPLITAAIEALPIRSCFIDGEAIVVDANGLSVFDLLRHRHHDRAAVLCAFDLIELEGKDLRRAPIEERKDLLAKLLRTLRRSQTGITLNEQYEGHGSMTFEHACRFGCEEIVESGGGSPTAQAGLMMV